MLPGENGLVREAMSWRKLGVPGFNPAWAKQVILKKALAFLYLNLLACAVRVWTGHLTKFPSCFECPENLGNKWRINVGSLPNTLSHFTMNLSGLKALPQGFEKESKDIFYSWLKLKLEEEFVKHFSLTLWCIFSSFFFHHIFLPGNILKV